MTSSPLLRMIVPTSSFFVTPFIPDSFMPIQFPERSKVAQTPTPIHRLERFESRLEGPQLWVKRDDLTGSAMSGNKIRKLEYHLPAIRSSGSDTLITCGGIQSNHCRTTALLAASAGLDCHLILRGEPPYVPRGNLFLDLFCGAQIHWVTPQEYRNVDPVFERIAASLRSQGRAPYLIPEGASDALGSFGYLTACEEIAHQAPTPTFTHLIHACGSGGTAAGLALGRAQFNLDTEIISIAVCDDRPTFEARIASILDRFEAQFGSPSEPIVMPTVLDDYVGEGYGISSVSQRNEMVRIARTEGIVLDPTYSGKALYALVKESQMGRFGPESRVLFLHTGGIYGLLAQAESFAPHLL
ncbi:MAG: D-cysteine desulfhydrase family protein [Planctomycetota bacterium]|nr:D-cysteine desulfhydrase family protein [Planctomycetota bacterium]